MKPYLLLSDIHFHDWSAFGGHDSEGVSTRLRIIMNEFYRATAALEAAGGDTIVIAGDMFHVRGSINPEVFNPVHSMIASLIPLDFKFIAIPGNHDLKSRETTEIGNAMQTLHSLRNFSVVTKPKELKNLDMFFLPWMSSSDGVRLSIKEIQSLIPASRLAELDLIIHAGINGVVTGLPDHGLDAAEVASWGFKRVFAGHYHNHKVFEGGKVVSIGATTHQTWSDVGTKAGFVLVYPDRIEWNASHAPEFVEITDTTSEDDLPLIVDGNYVRVRGKKATDAEINEMRADFLKLGAKGFSYQGVREVVSARGAVSTHSTVSLEGSVVSYIKSKIVDPDEQMNIERDALDILDVVRAKAA